MKDENLLDENTVFTGSEKDWDLVIILVCWEELEDVKHLGASSSLTPGLLGLPMWVPTNGGSDDKVILKDCIKYAWPPRFLLQCLEDLDSSLRKLNSRLFVIRGQPADVLPTLFKDWGTTYFTFEEDPEPFGRVRDQNIVAMCKEMNISVAHEHSHTLYNLEK